MSHQRCLQTTILEHRIYVKLVMIKHAVDNLAISKDRNHELGGSFNLSFEVRSV